MCHGRRPLTTTTAPTQVDLYCQGSELDLSNNLMHALGRVAIRVLENESRDVAGVQLWSSSLTHYSRKPSPIYKTMIDVDHNRDLYQTLVTTGTHLQI